MTDHEAEQKGYSERLYGSQLPNSCCLVMHSFGGGAEKVALLLARELVLRGWAVSIACLRKSSELARHVPAAVRLFMPESPGHLASLRFLGRLRTIVRQSSVVVGTLELQSLFVAALLAPGRAIGWLHKDLQGYFATRSRLFVRLYKALMTFAIRRSQCIVCVSDGILASSRALWPGYARRFVRLYNPLDIEEVQRLSLEEMRRDVADFFEKHKKIVLAVGRLEEQKNFVLLLEAFALLKREMPDVALCIAGEGSQRRVLEERTRVLGVEICMPGLVNPYPLMRKATVLALTSRYEGFSLVLAEGLALGLPIVAVDCPSGPAEVLENGRFGRLVEADATGIARALRETLFAKDEEKERQSRMCRAGEFSLEAQLPRWIELLRAAQAACSPDMALCHREGRLQ